MLLKDVLQFTVGCYFSILVVFWVSNTTSRMDLVPLLNKISM